MLKKIFNSIFYDSMYVAYLLGAILIGIIGVLFVAGLFYISYSFFRAAF